MINDLDSAATTPSKGVIIGFEDETVTAVERVQDVLISAFTREVQDANERLRGIVA